MSTILTNGLKLPDKGSVDWYSDMQNNYTILDGAVGTIADHTTALAGKAPAVHTHTKSDITDFPAYGNAAGTICEGNDSRLSDARTPVAHTHTKSDVTDLLNSNFIPSANNSYDLGSSSYQWNNVYSKNYFYNGVAWGLDKANVWTANNTFKNTDYQIGEIPSATRATYINFTDKNNASIGWIQRRIETSGASSVELMVYNKFTNSQPDTAGTVDYAMLKLGLTSSQTRFCEIMGHTYPRNNNAYDLGTSTNKWKTFNGINPGALSLPSSNAESFNGDLTNKTGNTSNNKTWSINGWGYVFVANVEENFISVVANDVKETYLATGSGVGNANIGVSFPIVSGREYFIYVKTSGYVTAYYVPTLGNV